MSVLSLLVHISSHYHSLLAGSSYGLIECTMVDDIAASNNIEAHNTSLKGQRSAIATLLIIFLKTQSVATVPGKMEAC